MLNNEDLKHAYVFEDCEVSSEEERERVLAILNQIGSLTFDFEQNENGWTAQCKEYPAILAGGTTVNPSSKEKAKEIRKAIWAALDADVTEKVSLESFQFTYA